MTHLGSGIWSYSRRSTGAIFFVTVPGDNHEIGLACGDARKTSAPNLRNVEALEAEVAIISIAQHASPKPIGQIEVWRAQLRILSRFVVMMLSSNR